MGKNDKPPALSDRGLLVVIAAYAGAFVVFGALLSSPQEILEGVIKIAAAKDTLITDYVAVGGLGAAFVNAGLLTLLASTFFYASAAKMTGPSVACLFLVLGFGLFGKNVLNIWPIVAGVFLYSRFKREPFSNHITTAFFGGALAPVFSEILFSTALPLTVAAPLSIGTSLVIGFILPPTAAHLARVHMGYSLYNIGFTAGVIGTLVVALYRSYGLVPDPVLIWSAGHNELLGGFLAALFISLIALGLFFDPSSFRRMGVILRQTGRAPCDFIALAGAGAVFVNMGLTGFMGLIYILAVGGEVNGPTIGGVFTIVGFAACGKHPRNIAPIMAGVLLGSLAKPWRANDPMVLLVALFSATLAPIAGQFGWRWGIVAGFIQSSAALSVGYLHGGLNLYNSGFAAGIVAAVLVPVIVALQTRRGRQESPL